jgi:small-conductance mechanosensitive channel
MTEAAITLVGALVGTVLVHTMAYAVAGRMVDGHGRVVAQSLVRRTRGPTRLLLPTVAVDGATAAVHLPTGVTAGLERGLGVLIVLAVAFLVVRLTFVVDDVVLSHYRLDNPDNLKARQVHTQVQVFRRVTAVVVAVLAVAVALLSFPAVRAAGAGLLASAGVIGIVAGVAAKPTATNIVAGLQIAISQPIRVDDVVVVEGHWGRVEQIALTYVVVRVWDLRRLVLPISYFIEHPFENWTKQTADIVGWVHLEVDYTAPVDAIRQELHRVLTASSDWDGTTWSLQVTSLGTETMQLRAIMSARDSSAAWNLECEVRERLVEFLQTKHPDALPRLRTLPVATTAPPPAAVTAASETAGDNGRRFAGP